MTGAILLGLVAGLLAGLFGVGAGALIVPALMLFLGLSQISAESTSLLALVPVFAVGAWRQHRYGNVRRRDGAVIGVLSATGVIPGVLIANLLPKRALELGFAALLAVVAVQLAQRALKVTDKPENKAD